MGYPPGQNVPASHSEKADRFSARDICARNRRDDEFWHSCEREVTVAEGGRTATLPAVSKLAQFRNGEEIDWLDWTSQSRAATIGDNADLLD
jgi:hypothetical protein